MKKEIELAKAIGEADDDMIAEAAPKKGSRKGFAIKVASVAACLALIICTLPLIGRNIPADPKNTKNPYFPYITGTEDEIAIYNKWFFEIQNSPYSGYSRGMVIDAALVGDEIGEVTVKQYNHIYPENKDEDISYKKAVLYEIKGVSPEVAVCLKYTEKSEASSTEHYYRYAKTDIDVATLADYFEKTAAKTYGDITRISVTILNKDGYTYNNDAAHTAELFDMLLGLDGTRALSDNESLASALSDIKSFARIDISSKVGAANRIDIFDNGYVLISSYTGSFEEYEKGIMLFRAENSAAIIDFIRNNFTANNPAYSGEHTANTLSEMSETSGAYIPSGIAE